MHALSTALTGEAGSGEERRVDGSVLRRLAPDCPVVDLVLGKRWRLGEGEEGKCSKRVPLPERLQRRLAQFARSVVPVLSRALRPSPARQECDYRPRLAPGGDMTE
ncbi:hypothetical protein Bbelb_091320 [Branchiostoma belcheri]|nr:hypothetical protein Bbelb_091320 [Branchiostoma belcheri]